MSRIPRNHDKLYFDKLIRTNKAESLLSMIHATYHAQCSLKKGEVLKDKIAERLEYAYKLFRDNVVGADSGAGSYSGSSSQFESQYTFGLEMGIWIDPHLNLSPLAIKVAKNDITIKDYFDIIMLNYFQPINNKIVHPLALILDYLISRRIARFTIDDIIAAFSQSDINSDSENVRLLMNNLIATNYFEQVENERNTYEYVSEIDINIIRECCNTEYVKKGYDCAKEELSVDQDYYNYLTADHRPGLKRQRIQDMPSTLVGYNKIYYGIPGCGKSYYIEHFILKDVDKNNNVIRTTFYLDYTNSDFVGQIYPTVKKSESGEEQVTYQEIPGPFTLALEKAYQTSQMVYLVIEEINRGNAASIFGDLFQLLDRLDHEYDDRVTGDSEYPINNEFIQGYLKKKGITIPRGQNKIFIPYNLTILATMNTSDQNVFPLDTAFKRRWEKQRIIPNWNSVSPGLKNKYIPFTDITWKTFVKTINKEIINKGDQNMVLEDKQLGPYFIKENLLVPLEIKDKTSIENINSLRDFVDNVIDYLYNDVTKFEHELLFSTKYRSFDDIYNAILNFDDDGNYVGDKSLCLKVFDVNNELEDKESVFYEE